MLYTSVGHFIDNALEYLDSASKGEEIVICMNTNKKIHLVLEENRIISNYNDKDSIDNFKPKYRSKKKRIYE